MQQLITHSILLHSKRVSLTVDFPTLILSDEYAYPPVHHDLHQILISQFAAAFHEQSLHQGEADIDCKAKYPLPIVFAIVQKNKRGGFFGACLKVLLGNLERKDVENIGIINYNIAKLSQIIGEYKKSVFYYQKLLKEQPFFIDAVYDHCRLLSKYFKRTQQSIQILQRHLHAQSPLNESPYLQSLYVSLVQQSKQNVKQVSRIFNGKKMKLWSYFNLALWMKKTGEIKKAEEMFSKLKQIMDKWKEETGEDGHQKDLKLLLMVKVNLAQIYLQHSKTDKAYLSHALTLFKQLQSHLPSSSKCSSIIDTINEQIDRASPLVQKSLSPAIVFSNKSYKQQTVRDLSVGSSGRHVRMMTGGNDQKQNMRGIADLNDKFQSRRKFNDKKLKYLLMKEKEINNFFKQIVVKKCKDKNKIEIKVAQTGPYFKCDQSIINKAKKELKQVEMEHFQKEFQEKRKMHQFKYNNNQLEEMLSKIMTNLDSYQKVKTIQKNEESRKTEKKIHQIGNSAIERIKTSRNYPLRSDRNNQKFRIKPNISKQKATQALKLYDTVSSFKLTATNASDGFKGVVIHKNRELSQQINVNTDVEETSKKEIYQSQPKEKTIRQLFAQMQLFKQEDNRLQTSKNMTEFDKNIKAGQLLEKEQKYKQAFQKYTQMYKNFKSNAQKQQILLKIAGVFEKQQEYDQAEKTYLKCSKYGNAKAFTNLGVLLLKLGKIKAGVQNLQKANCIKRFDLQIQNKLVYGYSLSDDTIDKALTLAHTILKKQPQCLQTLIMTANIMQKQGKIHQAIDIACAIDRYKQTEYIKHYIGLLYLQDSNVTQAFNYFKAALAIKPNHVPSLIQIGTILSDVKPKQSIAILNKVLQIQPNNRLALARLGKIYESVEGDYESAMQTYRAALQSQQNYESYIKIGDCLEKQQQYLQALLNFKEALALKKTHQVHSKIARMHQKKGENLKAIQNYQIAIDLLPKEHHYFSIRREYLIEISKLYIRVSNFDTAIECIEQVLAQQENIQLYNMLSKAWFGKGEYGLALECYEKVSQIVGEQDIETLQNMAVCFDKLEEYHASKLIYQKILVLHPQNVRCINNLANILLIIGETNEAFYLFQSLIQKQPGNLDKRLKIADIYAAVGDWSKVEYHLMGCMKIKENDTRVLQKLVNLYKQKRDMKLVGKYEKRLLLIKENHKHKAQKN